MQINIRENKKEIKEHGSYAFPVNISLEKIQLYEQGFFIWHWHPEIEITWIISGSIEYHINEQTYLLSEGQGIFGNSNTLHSGYRIDDQECSYLSITFHPRFLYGYENSILQSKYVNFIASNDAWSSFVLEKTVDWHQDIIEDMKVIYALEQNPPSDYEYQVHMLIMKIWHRIYQYYASLPDTDKKSGQHLQRLRDMMTYIQEHYASELSLEDIAKSANICKSECCRFFKKHMNMTIFDYVLFLRIQNSLALLQDGLSITEAANEVGFSSPAYYGQIFKRYMKCTPSKYKKSLQNNQFL